MPISSIELPLQLLSLLVCTRPYGPFLSLLFLARAMVKVASGFGLSSFTSLGDATYAQLNKPASHSPMALKRAFVKGRGSAKDGGRPLAWVSATHTHAHI